jgi:hypothetical protein
MSMDYILSKLIKVHLNSQLFIVIVDNKHF